MVFGGVAGTRHGGLAPECCILQRLHFTNLLACGNRGVQEGDGCCRAHHGAGAERGRWAG